MSEWRFVKAVFRNAQGEEHVFSQIGPGITVEDLKRYLKFEVSDASKEYPWEYVRTVKDEKWHSSCVLWRDNKTIDEMYDEW